MTKSSDGAPVFKKIPGSEKRKLIQQVTDENRLIRIKVGKREELIHIVPIHLEEDGLLLCHHTMDSRGFNENQMVVANFSLFDERYFFSTEMRHNSGWITLDTGAELFHFQRRASYRVHLPIGYDAVFSLIKHGDNPREMECVVRDLSSGGIKMQMPEVSPYFKAGDKITGSLRLGSKKPMEIDLEIRSARILEVDGIRIQYVGSRFINLEYMKENKLMMMIMDVQREVQARYPKKK